MALTDTSHILFDGMRSTLDSWAARFQGERELLYWLLRLKVGEIAGDTYREESRVPQDLRGPLSALRQRTEAYWGDIRYAALEPITMLWGTIVNAMRVAAQSGRATDVQKKTFDFPATSLVTFFLSARDR